MQIGECGSYSVGWGCLVSDEGMPVCFKRVFEARGGARGREAGRDNNKNAPAPDPQGQQ